MPDQYVVPQFIDNEDTIFGPVTARQFIILIATGVIEVILFKLLTLVWFLVFGVPIIMIGGVIAFVRINGQPFHFFILNFIQTFKKPHIRVWDKSLTDAQLREYIKEKLPPPPIVFERKAHVGTSRLQELTLVVNTGGVYQPEE